MALVAFIAFDQTSPSYRPDAAGIAQVAEGDLAFVTRVEASVPRGSAILQLPYMAFPESPGVYRLSDYDQLRPYLHSQDLRWSYGTVKGRPTDWHRAVRAYPLGALLAGVAASGFDGIVVDRYGYSDGGAALEAGLTAHLGPPLVRDRSGRFDFYGLADLAQRAAASPVASEASEAILRPVAVEPGQGTFPEERSGPTSWQWAAASAELELENPSSDPRVVEVSGEFTCECTVPKVSTFSLPDGSTASVRLDATLAPLRRTITLPPGWSRIVVTTTGPSLARPPWDPQELHVRLKDLVVVPVVLCQLADEVEAASGGSSRCTDEGHPQVGG